MLDFRKATEADTERIVGIYSEIHTTEETGESQVGWIRGIYPVKATAEAALARGDLFVAVADGVVVGSAIINQIQVKEYVLGKWCYDVPDDRIMVLHTLAISPHQSGKGYGKSFVAFYENYARDMGCKALRMDTNERNERARAMYKKLGYSEIGIVPCNFNGIEGVNLVLLEKKV